MDVLADVFEAAPIGMALIDPATGRFVRLNAAARAVTGHSEDELLSLTFPEITNPGDRSAEVPGFSDLVAGMHVEQIVERRYLCPEGRTHWVRVGRRSVTSDGTTLVLAVVEDITERKHVEEALRRSEERFRSFADTAPAILWITEPDGSSIFVSRRWCEVTGQTEAEALGFGWVDAIHEDDRAGIRQLLEGEGHEAFAHDLRIRHHNGEYRWALTEGRPRFDHEGRFLGYVGSVIDIHERRQAEMALREADRRKDEFLATLSHELRNPLAPMRIAAHIMRVAADNPQRMAQAVAIMERQLGQLVRLIEDLLNVSRISRGKLQLKCERVDLREALQRAVETSLPQIGEAHHDLKLSLPDDPVLLEGDLSRLAQVFSNLLNNAVRYTRPGGSIELTLERRDTEAVVRVRDNGIGIPSDALTRVFEMFTQVGEADRDHEGLGIGLALARGIVELHGGRIEAYSGGRGKGSTFSVSLPLCSKMALHESARLPAAIEPFASQRVLVADDHADTAKSLAVLLGMMGQEVRTVQDGFEAVDMAREFRPHLIFMDIAMPRLDGLEAVRRIREQGSTARIYALSGWGQEVDREKSLNAGCDGHLVKPLEPEQLTRVLAECVAARG